MGLCFGITGGDRRQTYLAELLREDGHQVLTEFSEAITADVLVLPLPLCREPGIFNSSEVNITTRSLFRQLSPRQHILAGMVQPEQAREAAACGLTVTDYFKREELAVANAAATAEGAIQTAMEQLDRTLLGLPCLVLGFGRIGKLLAYRLHGSGAQVSVAARSIEARAWVRAYGWNALDSSDLHGQLCPYGVIFNTIPAPVLDSSLLAETDPSCLLMELASTNGIDAKAAGSLRRPYLLARGIPGRLNPRTAATAVRDTVYALLRESIDSTE